MTQKTYQELLNGTVRDILQDKGCLCIFTHRRELATCYMDVYGVIRDYSDVELTVNEKEEIIQKHIV